MENIASFPAGKMRKGAGKRSRSLSASGRLCHAQFYAAALSGMTADWLRGGMKSNVNDHIDRLGRLLEGNIRQALERSCR